MNRSIRIFLQLAGLLFTGAALLAADNTIAIIAVSDITEQGQGTRRAMPVNPVYYHPHTTGFSNSGATIDGVVSPPKPSVEIMLVKALSSQGYIYHKLVNKPPSVTLVFAWGCMAPQLSSDGRRVQNKKDMSALVEGIHPMDPNEDSLQADKIRAAVIVPRFYLTISALDFNALTQNKYVTLWCTRVSTEVEGNQLAQVLPALIQAATPLIGTQTYGPRVVMEPLATAN
jgi:hypothetical protein